MDRTDYRNKRVIYVNNNSRVIYLFLNIMENPIDFQGSFIGTKYFDYDILKKRSKNEPVN